MREGHKGLETEAARYTGQDEPRADDSGGVVHEMKTD